jgi:2-polyprenyl-3-methyl-5-hydroxy-6-metoxy-1,4-benzoquinol methylase
MPNAPEHFSDDLAAIRTYYEGTFLKSTAWSLLHPHAFMYMRQRQRRIRDGLAELGFADPEKIAAIDVLDVGCGPGGNLAWVAELGADPARCTGVDLVPSRIELANQRNSHMRWIAGDLLSEEVGGPYDFIMLLAVLTSVLNPALKRQLVARCFELLKPGGGLFFYDLMTVKEHPGNDVYKMLTYGEAEDYFGGRDVRWFKRDYLRADLAKKLVPRFGVPFAELVQAVGWWNIEGSFAIVRK